jgi:hypothetical protein
MVINVKQNGKGKTFGASELTLRRWIIPAWQAAL